MLARLLQSFLESCPALSLSVDPVFHNRIYPQNTPPLDGHLNSYLFALSLGLAPMFDLSPPSTPFTPPQLSHDLASRIVAERSLPSPPPSSSFLSPSPPPPRRRGPCQTWSLLDWVNQQGRATQVPRTVPQPALAVRLFGHWLVHRFKGTQYEKSSTVCTKRRGRAHGLTQIPPDPIARTTVSRYAQLSTLRASVQHTQRPFTVSAVPILTQRALPAPATDPLTCSIHSHHFYLQP
ncbi:hypothetical protein LZ30DRAFT_730356 [Colletotrichum cereale]|nr:hypothetical protein LZ30DRAFT_730356 [Colletotrichum cereale]